MICLGIESTAHTFSIGLVDDQANILSLISDTFSPPAGGLKPFEVFEHHYNCFHDVLNKAIKKAKILFSDINLISFSQGPGLGPTLRMGAVFARTLALKLNVPLVGVNHCIAHVEIGRVTCNIEDPITLYVSGGNTLITAFESKRYQIFGETMDISIGNLVDMIARDCGISHPGGPVVEKLALNGNRYLNLPYVVKGMDLSFSGIYSAAKKYIQRNELNDQFKADLMYSIQETAFSMLAEVFERAIAHTNKKTALLTGGVAANKRIQEMLRLICKEHGVQFHVVENNIAGDNGGMIAWTGILQYYASSNLKIPSLLSEQELKNNLSSTQIHPKWRINDVPIPWRDNEFIKFKRLYQSKDGLYKKKPSDEEIILRLSLPDAQIHHRGAEAAIIKIQSDNRFSFLKYRYPKSYRIDYIDNNIRKKRTLFEIKTLIKLSEKGLPVPIIYDFDLELGYFCMQHIPWQTLKILIPKLTKQELKDTFYNIGQYIAQMHQFNISHGDLTTSNILWDSSVNFAFIDFGLAQNDIGLEEKAMDLHLFKQVLQSSHGSVFSLTYSNLLKGYSEYLGENKTAELVNRIKAIENRGRYIAKISRTKK